MVESCVNFVGVDLNTASAALLRYVAGISEQSRPGDRRPPDRSRPLFPRTSCSTCPDSGPRLSNSVQAFCAFRRRGAPGSDGSPSGVLFGGARRSGDERGRLRRISRPGEGVEARSPRLESWIPKMLARHSARGPYRTGHPGSLGQTRKGPQRRTAPPLLRADVLELEHLHPGTTMEGTVTNVVDFGAFVDIGVEKAGLIHVSRMGRGYVTNPYDVLSVGDIVTVQVMRSTRAGPYQLGAGTDRREAWALVFCSIVLGLCDPAVFIEY